LFRPGIIWGLQTGFGIDVGKRPLTVLEECDIAVPCRRVLMSYKAQYAAQRTFGDIIDRLPCLESQSIRKQYRDLQWPSASEVDEALQTPAGQALMDMRLVNLIRQAFALLEDPAVFNAESTSFCHRKQLRVKTEDVSPGVLNGERGIGPLEQIRFAAGGVICRDWSKQGLQMGFAGKSARAYFVFVAERRVRREPFFCQECTPSSALIMVVRNYLSDLYDIEVVELCPSMFGHPHRRRRQWVTGVRRDFAIRTRPMSEMIDAFGCQVIITGDEYFCLDGEDVEQHIHQRACARKLARADDGQAYTFREVLSQHELGHLEGYEESRRDLIAAGRLSNLDPWISDLLQSPYTKKYDGSTWMLQTLLQHTERWSHQKQRCLTGDETLASMGMPTPAVVRKLSQVAPAAAAGLWECPFGSACGSSWLNDHLKKRLAGDGMHLVCAGAVMIWLLSHTVPLASIQCAACPMTQPQFDEDERLDIGDEETSDGASSSKQRLWSIKRSRQA
jgi:hypothetical protein